MTRLLILNDNSQHVITRCGEARGHLWITLSDVSSVQDAYAIFSDPETTSHMTDTYDYAGAPAVDYDGYTLLTLIRQDRRGVTLCLSLPETAEA